MKRPITIAILVVLAVLAFFILSRSRSRGEAASEVTELADLATIKYALSLFELDCGRYPTTEEGLGALIKRPETIPEGLWHGPYMEERKVEKDPSVKPQVADQRKVLTDFWGRPYVYVFPCIHNPDGYDVYSLGRYGKGGDEAIGNWKFL